jgi:hypothetical protein
VKPVLSTVAFISGLYDAVVGAFLLVAADSLAVLFGVPPASPRIFSDLNGLFLLAVGAGYYLPWRDPIRYRGYMWVMGPLLKGGGAALFLLDYFLRGSPASFLLFAASDGTLAVVTWWALRADPVASGVSRKTAAGAELPPEGGSHG